MLETLTEIIGKAQWDEREARSDAVNLFKQKPRPWNGNDEKDVGRFEYGRTDIRRLAAKAAQALLDSPDVKVTKS